MGLLDEVLEGIGEKKEQPATEGQAQAGKVEGQPMHGFHGDFKERYGERKN